MKQLHHEKQTIAWFKLADLVQRGEKERALAILRLLTHAFEDKALAHQLQADVLYSFDDNSCIDYYRNAAQLYQQRADYKQALGLYEHMSALQTSTSCDVFAMLELAKVLKNDAKIAQFYKQALHYAITPAQQNILVTTAAEFQLNINSIV